MIFQHMCHIKVSPEDVQFARKALCTPDMVKPEKDFTIGETTIWSGSTVEVRLCGIPGQHAFMAAAVFNSSGELQGFSRSETYRESFQFQIGNVEYLIMLHEDSLLDKDATKAPSA